MSHTHSASFDSALLPLASRQTHTPAPTPAQAPPTTLPLLQPMDLASYCTPTPLISHTAVAYPAALSNERYTPHPQPHSLNPPQRGAYAGHASMASIDSIHSVGSLGSVSSLTSVFSGQTDAPAYPQSYSVSGTPYLHPTPLMHLGSTYDSPGQTQHHSHHDRSSVDVDAYGQGVLDSHSDWEQFRPGRAHEVASGYGGLAEYDSLSEAIELRMSLGMGRADMSGMAGVHPADGLGMGTLPEWRGYPYAQPGYGDPALWGEMHEKMKTRRHVCPVCEKRFNRPSSLNTHMAVHTGAKPYKCPKDDCGRCFSVSSNLRRHMKTHNIREIKKDCVGPPCPRSGGPKTHPPSAHSNVGSSSPSESASPASSSCSAPSIHPPLELNPATASTTNASSMSPLTSLAPLTFPRAMHTHTRSNPLASLAPIGPIVPYTHSYPHSFSSFAYDSATPSLGLAATTATSGSGSGMSAFGMSSGGAGNAGFNTPLPSGMSVLSFGSSSTAMGLDQYSLRRSSASVGGD